MLTLIYFAIYILSFVITALILTICTVLFTREGKSASKIGFALTQIIFLVMFLVFTAQANPLGIVLQ